MSFLRPGSFTEAKADQVPTVRVLVVGNSSSGKTTLCRQIAEDSCARSIAPTVGCTVHLKLLTKQELETHGLSCNHNQLFVELWDVSGHSRYKDLRTSFYRLVNGVMLVHDLTDSNSFKNLRSWASEVARQGSFVAPFSEEIASRNVGRLPVPVLVVGNKLDLVRGSKTLLLDLLKCQYASPLSLLWKISKKKLEAEPVELQSSGKSLQSSALRGSLDMQTVYSFFLGLLDRRYNSASAYLTAPSYKQLFEDETFDRRVDEEWA